MIIRDKIMIRENKCSANIRRKGAVKIKWSGWKIRETQ